MNSSEENSFMENNNRIIREEYCETDYLKFIVVYLISVIALLLMIKGILSVDILCKEEKATDVLMVIFAAITLGYTFIQYKDYRKREKADVLGQYNERYSRDGHVNRVVDYIIRYMDNKVIYSLPSVHDAEMFMRFFEEMQVQIDEERLDEKQVYDLFSYYAVFFDLDEALRNNLGIHDYHKEWVWNLFKKFSSNMVKRHRLPGSIWKSRKGDHVLKELHFHKDIVLCTSLHDKKETETSEFFSYKKGIIDIGGYIFIYQPSMDDSPDKLYCQTNGCYYIEEK